MALSLSNLKDSIDRVLFERMSSPLFGTYLFAWCVWNWKILYVTLFVDEQRIGYDNKLDYISEELMNPWFVYAYPIISTIVLLLVYPALSNLSYSLSLWFTKKKRNIKHKWEERTPLTKEESNAIRVEHLRKSEEHKSYIHDLQIQNGKQSEELNELTLTKTNLEEEIRKLRKTNDQTKSSLSEANDRLQRLEQDLNERLNQSEVIDNLKQDCKRLTSLISFTVDGPPNFVRFLRLYSAFPLNNEVPQDGLISLAKEAAVIQNKNFRSTIDILVANKLAYYDPASETFFFTNRGKYLWLNIKTYYHYRNNHK